LHKENKQRKTKKIQQFITSCTSTSSKSTFNNDLCTALTKADIPLRKLDKLNFRQFFEKYTDSKMPDESTLKKNYLPDLHEKTLTDIRKNISSGPIWISTDETTNIYYYINIAFGRGFACAKLAVKV